MLLVHKFLLDLREEVTLSLGRLPDRVSLVIGLGVLVGSPGLSALKRLVDRRRT